MAEGVDYSFAPPAPQCLASNGKEFALRYVGTSASGKNLREAEATALRTAGVDIAAIYQTTANFMLQGRERGIAAAQAAVSDARRYGYPAGRPIYYALDTDPRVLTEGQWDAIEAFCAGAASVTGRGAVGVYGGHAAIERLVPTHAAFGFQTYAWSNGKLSTKAHVYQYRNGVSLCGGTVDLCRSLKADFGQWSQEDDVTPEEVKGVLDSEAQKVRGIVSWERYMEVVLDTVRAANRTAEEAKAAANAAVVAASRDMVDEAAIGEAVSLAVVPAVVNAVLEKIPDDIKVDLDLALLTEAAEAGAKQAFREGTG